MISYRFSPVQACGLSRLDLQATRVSRLRCLLGTAPHLVLDCVKALWRAQPAGSTAEEMQLPELSSSLRPLFYLDSRTFSVGPTSCVVLRKAVGLTP